MNAARPMARTTPATPAVSSISRVSEAIAEANAHAAAGRYGNALSIVRDASAKNPESSDLLFAEASTLSTWGRFRDVCSSCDQPWVEESGHVPLFLTLGRAYLSTGKPGRAEAWLRRAADAAPGDWKAHFSLGAALRLLNRLEEAVASYERALALQPDSFDCRIDLVACRFEQRDFSSAEAEARCAIVLDGKRPVAWENLGIALAKQDRHGEAREAFRKAMQLESELGGSGGSFINAASNLVEAGDVDAAIALYDPNLARFPSHHAHNEYAFALLTAGRLLEGWHHYEFRWTRAPLLPLRARYGKPVWAGQDLRGKAILLRAEQGSGDAIQFLRYAASVKALGAKVLLGVDGFGALAERFAGIDAAIDPQHPLPAFDFYLHLLSLPRIFGTDLGSIPADVPYVQPRPDHVERWAARLAPHDRRLKVGLVWAGRPTHDGDRRRSITLDTLAPLGDIAGVRYIGLQKEVAPSMTESSSLGGDFVNLGPELQDFHDTAALIANVDLVICVDTAVAHLAGALGKPVWVMLPEPADFRWLRDREDTPWYPTMRLFRQQVSGDWSGVVQRVKAALNLRLQEAPTLAAPKTLSPNATFATRLTFARLSPGHKLGFSGVAETRLGIVQYFPDEPVVGDSIDWYGEYLQGQLDVLGRILKPGMTVIEVDAGVGMHALYLAAAVGPSGHAYLYESRPLMQKLLRQNLAFNQAGVVTVMKRSLRCGGVLSSDADMETIDDLQLKQLHMLKVGEHTPALDVIAGATQTLWQLRPLLFLATTDGEALDVLSRRTADLGYRRWQMDTPLFNPENFNRRENDIFAGKKATVLIGVPEEIEFDPAFAGCTELV
jgi:Flp pilus assembly protein TadD